MYDRELILFSVEQKKHLSNSNELNLTWLTQHLVGSTVVVKSLRPELLREKGLASQITIDLAVRGESVGPLHQCKKYAGHRYPPDINLWFSTAIQREVILAHASSTYNKLVAKETQVHSVETDKHRAFTTDAAVHLIAEASVADLKQRVL